MTQNVLIVGGGTAGWMTAAYLIKAFPDLDITLVESARIGTIGVGESTFSTVKVFFDFLGLKESDWMGECGATFKMAVKFVNWSKDQPDFYHPFQRFDSIDGFNSAEWWLKVQPALRFDHACFTVAEICDQDRSPRHIDGSIFDENIMSFFDTDAAPKLLSEHHEQYPYGYHFDALLFAQYISRYAIARGVRHIVDDVLDIELGDDGAIAAVNTQSNGKLESDLYVDCTGFRGLLINHAMQEPFIPFDKYLLADSAVALQFPSNAEDTRMAPYTTATALSSGWSWSIPLFSRSGAGYVYSSEFITPEQAEAELRAYVGPAADGARANHLKMRVGRCKNSWVKNCVAIGLSSGFVEPLESSGIFFIQHSIEQLAAHFPKTSINPIAVDGFNQSVGNCIDGVRDFLVLHYRASNRRDTAFWRSATQVRVPKELEERLKLWKACLPNDENISKHYHGFEAYSYAVIVLGLGYHQRDPLSALAEMSDVAARKYFGDVSGKARQLVESLPSQRDYLTSFYQGKIPALPSVPWEPDGSSG